MHTTPLEHCHLFCFASYYCAFFENINIVVDSILSVRGTNKSDSSLGKAAAEVTTEVTYVGSPAPAHLSRVSARSTLNGVLDQSWPLSAVASSGLPQRNSFCDNLVIIFNKVIILQEACNPFVTVIPVRVQIQLLYGFFCTVQKRIMDRLYRSLPPHMHAPVRLSE